MGPVKRDIPPLRLYAIYVTDKKNEVQVEQTRIWLEGLIKNKSKMTAMKTLNDVDDIPWAELAPLAEDYDAWNLALDKYERTDGWMHVLLDEAGYETVLERTEWIVSVQEERRFRVVPM